MWREVQFRVETVRFTALLLLLMGIILPFPTAAQTGSAVTVVGRVVGAESNEPLSRTHVFIPRSMSGTTTDSTGRFRMKDVSLGSKRLYVSRIGYKDKAFDLRPEPGRTLTYTVRLEKKVIEGPAVTVSGERSEEWYERLRRFKRLFIGESGYAQRCTLVNPEVLRFEKKWWGKFEASAQEPLVIENRALGYRLTYFLKEFEERGNVVRWDGEPLFEALTPEDSLQRAQWRKNRLQAYRGSLRHFLRALLDGRLKEEQFEVYRLPRASAFRHVGRADRLPTSRSRLIEPGPDSTYLFDARDRIEVIYRGEPESEAYLEWADIHRRSPREYQTSRIELNQHPIHIDPYGEIVEPYGATLYRHFGFTVRMAELLPREYSPSE